VIDELVFEIVAKPCSGVFSPTVPLVLVRDSFDDSCRAWPPIADGVRPVMILGSEFAFLLASFVEVLRYDASAVCDTDEEAPLEFFAFDLLKDVENGWVWP
jgi:hypothetical protein